MKSRQQHPQGSPLLVLDYMRAFAEAWQDEDFVQQVAAQLPWFHNCVLLDKLKSNEERARYSQLTIQNGWSRNVLVHQIESDLFHRQGRAITNACPAGRSLTIWLNYETGHSSTC